MRWNLFYVYRKLGDVPFVRPRMYLLEIKQRLFIFKSEFVDF